MKLLHVIPSLDPKSGGPARAVTAYANITQNFADVTIAATNEGFQTENTKAFIRSKTCIKDSVNIMLHNYIGYHSYKYSHSLRQWLYENITSFDMVHLHAAFSFMTTISAAICRKFDVPYVFRPLGTLSDFSVNKGAVLAKKVYYNLFESKTLHRAKIIHVTSNQEAEQIHRLINASVPVQVIPIPEAVKWHGVREKSTKVLKLGFLSRIHPKKNIETLFKALKEINFPVRLHIAGTGKQAYIDRLMNKAEALSVHKKIEWLGFVSDEQKPAFFDEIDYLILPSRHENFGIAVIEALAYGRPVIISSAVDSASWIDIYGCGFITTQQKSSVINALRKAHNIPQAGYRVMSESTRKVFKKEFHPEKIQQQLKELYGA